MVARSDTETILMPFATTMMIMASPKPFMVWE